MFTCWEYRGCTASLYLMCEAYKRGLNCWEYPDKPCCKRKDLTRCRECEVYLGVMRMRARYKKVTTCIDCGKTFEYTTSRPKRCPDCRKKKRNKKQLERYYKQKKSKVKKTAK